MNILDKIEKYDVLLTRLSKDKIEEVRMWRNDPKISQYMEYREFITAEQQYSWFKKINNERNLYYIVSYKGEDIGLINIKDIDADYKVGEGGIFIYVDKYLNTDLSYRAHLCLFDYCFENLGLQIVLSHILKENKRAQRFAMFLGSTLEEGQENENNQKYSLLRENYLKNKNRLSFIRRYENKKNN